MNLPTTSVPEDIDKALDNLIDWIIGHEDEELPNIDFRKAKREVLTTVESYGDRRELEGHLDGKQDEWNAIWDEWLKGDDDEFDDFLRRENEELWKDGDAKVESKEEKL